MMGDKMVKLELWVPEALLDDARQAVQDVTDDHERPELPLPSWARPLDETARGRMRGMTQPDVPLPKETAPP